MGCAHHSNLYDRECYLHARTTPESGVMLVCCSLIVTVPLEGLVHERVYGWLAVIWRVLAPPGMLMALYLLLVWANATTVQESQRLRGAVKRMVTAVCCGCWSCAILGLQLRGVMQMLHTLCCTRTVVGTK